MSNLFRDISENWDAAIFCSVIIFLFLFLVVFVITHLYKRKRMFDNDALFEERYENGTIKQKSYHRNIWDLSPFPSLSKLFFRDDWKIAIATYLLLTFLILYLITKEQWFADLIKVNFGLILGALLGKKVNG